MSYQINSTNNRKSFVAKLFYVINFDQLLKLSKGCTTFIKSGIKLFFSLLFLASLHKLTHHPKKSIHRWFPDSHKVTFAAFMIYFVASSLVLSNLPSLCRIPSDAISAFNFQISDKVIKCQHCCKNKQKSTLSELIQRVSSLLGEPFSRYVAVMILKRWLVRSKNNCDPIPCFER